AVAADRADGADRLAELLRLVEDHAAAGSELARGILARDEPASDFWVVEPVGVGTSPTPPMTVRGPATLTAVEAIPTAAMRGAPDSTQPSI
ncbi:MAG TPA: hypothetical protein VM408_01565, partial [Methylomirabilota bacterium]|nr:hypothetical protein [Methylomirabilota bacterium]